MAANRTGVETTRPPAAARTATTAPWRAGWGGPLWVAVAAVEVAIAAAVVVRDVLVPTIVILLLAALSLAARRQGPGTLGFHRMPRPGRAAGQILALTVGWTVLQLAVFLPVLQHATGERQDLRDFEGLRGNLGTLLALLAISWTLAAVGEEAVYRGYVQTRVTDVAGSGTTGVVLAVLVSSVLFGLAHSEQGVIGMAATFLDAVFFSVLRLRYRSLWAPVLAHGFNNTIGLVAFFLAGPFYGLW
jgi:membrane protease YdiL (CAAX protease family)